jgi:hypothetical protein
MSTGGSRFGAGRPATHAKVEACRLIDVRRWQREGVLHSGSAGAWSWRSQDTGERLAEIGYRCSGASVDLNYSVQGRDCSQRVLLTTSACNFGGTRPWFLCPVGGERVAVLYMRGGRFACRHCQRLAYSSQSADELGRLGRRQWRIEARLGNSFQRPKGMHQATHARLLASIWDCEARQDRALALHVGALMQRYPSLREDPLLASLR